MSQSSAGTYSSALSITPIDGRYYPKIKILSDYFSEFALYRFRLFVEVEYLKKLSGSGVFVKFTKTELSRLDSLVGQFGTEDYAEIKKIEDGINHDVKSVEYFLREKLNNLKMSRAVQFIHFGLTSEDTNNLAYGLMIKSFKLEVAEKELDGLVKILSEKAYEYRDIPLLGRTHGQPAVGTTLGKEFANYAFRLKKISEKMKVYILEGKCNGAVGNNNALKAAVPDTDWVKLGKQFVTGLGLETNPMTTQILPYDNWLGFFQLIVLANGILSDLSKNLWLYIMQGVFIQQKKSGEVGSSTMPQKINPINFEQAEGNLEMANSMFNYFVQKLTHSRLQRDLSDSTTRRNFGSAFAYSLLGWKNVAAGISRISPDEKFLKNELNSHWEILSEAVQTVLRLKGDKDGYEKLKKISRGRVLNGNDYRKILIDLGLEDDKRLKDLTPEKYLGYAPELAGRVSKSR